MRTKIIDILNNKHVINHGTTFNIKSDSDFNKKIFNLSLFNVSDCFLFHLATRFQEISCDGHAHSTTALPCSFVKQPY